jgi:hypothetical protein
MAKKVTTEDVAASNTDDIVDAMFGKDKPGKKKSKSDVDKAVKQRESAVVHNAKIKEEMIAQGKKEATQTSEGGTPRQQLQKMFDGLTAEEKAITEKTKGGFLKTVANQLANENTSENVFKRLIVDLNNRKVGKKFVAKADAPEGVPVDSTGEELVEDVPPTEEGAKKEKTKGTSKSRLQSSINQIRDEIKGGKNAMIGGKNIPPEIFSRLEKMATESKTKLLSGEGLDIHPDIEKMTDAEASAFGENLKKEVEAHYSKVDKEGRKVYEGRVKAAPKSKNAKIVEILEKEKATGKMGFGGKAAIGVGLGALGMLGLKQAFGDDGKATQQIRERAQQEQLNQKSRQIADYLEQARMTQDTQDIKGRLAQSAPDLYTSVMAGRRVPRGSVVLGGQPRDDLMQQLVASMNQRG